MTKLEARINDEVRMANRKRATARWRIPAALALLILVVDGCGQQPAAPPVRAVVHPTVASLVPAATDLILGMGAGDHLVAVSTYDYQREGIIGLPRVGDYQTFDWEQLATVHPDIMIVFMAPERMPEGLKQRAADLKIRLVNVRTETLDDLFSELSRLGELIDEMEKASAAARKLHAQLDAVRRRVAGLPKSRALIARESGLAVVGRGNFINDCLEIAGGENVIESVGWPSIDRELLLNLKPEVIFHLLPDASSQVQQDSQRLWENMPELPAVRERRVRLMTQWWTQQPGIHVGDLAEMFADALHPAATMTRPAKTD